MNSTNYLLLSALGAWLLALAGCSCSDEAETKPGPTPAATSRPLERAPAQSDQGSSQEKMLPLQGGALSAEKDALFIANEDHQALQVVPLPLNPATPITTISLPGPPAQVLAWGENVAVTIRQPSLLLIYEKRGGQLTQSKRVELADDAWGLALSPDRRSMWVSSAWSSFVSVVDLDEERVRWSFKVNREPRGILLSEDGSRATVSHLVGAKLTVLVDQIDKAEESFVKLPAAPLRAPTGIQLEASLGYSILTSPDFKRIFVPRHALGALGKNAWFGAMTIDVMSTVTNSSVVPVRSHGNFGAKSSLAETLTSGSDTRFLGQSSSPVTQPRAALYRKSNDTIFVAGEGDDRVVEFDARALDPTLAVLRVHELGGKHHKLFGTSERCGAPTGLALSEDEKRLWVYCRSTDSLIELDLEGHGQISEGQVVVLREPSSDVNANTGRALFFNATDRTMSGGLACAGCHPDGRDDGHVWHEANFMTADGVRTNFVARPENIPDTAHTEGFPRRTPMLAGRLGHVGPFGWHGESETLPDREIAGFALHRWGAAPSSPDVTTRSRALFLAKYLREELLPPQSKRNRELSEQQQAGEQIFLSAEAQCAGCHVPETGYTNQQAFPLPPLKTRVGFDAEDAQAFKTPSLNFLLGRAPYFHDGSVSSLYSLIETNHDRMGQTSHLDRKQRDALIAFLGTL